MTQPPVAAPSRPPSNLPLVAGILSLSGLCFPPLIFVGPILGVIALAQGKGSRGWAITAIAVPLAVVPLAVAISWPMFHATQRHQRESECRGFLRQAFTAEAVERAEHGAYSTDWEKIGFAPDGQLRYAYFFSREVVMTRPFAKHPLPPMERLKGAMTNELLDDLGPHGDCAQECWITMACAGDLFDDGELDVWSVSTRERKDQYGLARPAGELIYETAK